MKYDFDQVIERRGTDSVKYDLLKPLFGNEEILPMWVADMDFAVPDFVMEAVLERARHPVYGYTIRPKRYYESISGWLERRHNWKVDPDHIDFSPGVVPALVLAVLGYTEPGDKILVQSPVYFPFFNSIKDHGRVIVNNQLILEGSKYQIDFEDLEKKFKTGVKMMMFCHPHNPVGRAWNMEELKKLAELAIRYNVLILSDEIHSDLLLFGNKHIPFASLGDEIAGQTLTCIAPSKTFNLAGLHTSAVIIEDAKLMKTYKDVLEHIHVGGGNIFGFVALEAAYDHGDQWLEELLNYLEGNFQHLRKFLDDKLPGIWATDLEATYLAWLNFGKLGLSDKELMNFIVRIARLGLVDGPRFGDGGEQFMRMNIATPRKVFDEALGQLEHSILSEFPEKF